MGFLFIYLNACWLSALSSFTFCLPHDEQQRKKKLHRNYALWRENSTSIWKSVWMLENAARISTFVIHSIKNQPKKMFTIKFIFHTYRTRTVWWRCHFFPGLSRCRVMVHDYSKITLPCSKTCFENLSFSLRSLWGTVYIPLKKTERYMFNARSWYSLRCS